MNNLSIASPFLLLTIILSYSVLLGLPTFLLLYFFQKFTIKKRRFWQGVLLSVVSLLKFVLIFLLLLRFKGNFVLPILVAVFTEFFVRFFIGFLRNKDNSMENVYLFSFGYVFFQLVLIGFFYFLSFITLLTVVNSGTEQHLVDFIKSSQYLLYIKLFAFSLYTYNFSVLLLWMIQRHLFSKNLYLTETFLLPVNALVLLGNYFLSNSLDLRFNIGWLLLNICFFFLLTFLVIFRLPGSLKKSDTPPA